MKRKIIFTILLILIISITISLLRMKNLKSNFKNNISENTKFISIMVQDEEGHYQERDAEFSKEGYHFNSNRSKCLNDSKLKFEDNNLIVESTKSDKCYVYFDNNNFVEDLSGNGNHGKNKNALWQTNGLVSGDEANYYGFVDCGLANYDFKDTISYIVRLKFNKFTDNEAILGNWDESGSGIFLFHNQFGLNFANNNKFTPAYSDVETIDYNWHIFVGTFDGDDINLYIDGKLVKTQIIDSHKNIDISSSPIGLGGDISGSGVTHPSYATYGEALVFDRILTSEEITKDYTNEINPTNKDKLLLWYKFD